MDFLEKLSLKIKYIIKNWKPLHTVVSVFLFFYLVLIYKLFTYTVFDNEFYNKLADSQQIWKFEVPVNRWKIYSSIEREWKTLDKLSVLATSVNFYDLAIDPKMVWSKEKLWKMLVDLVYDELCKSKDKKTCKDNILKYLKKSEIKDFQTNKDFIKNLLKDYIYKKISKTKLESVSLWNDFKKEEIKKIKNLEIAWVYPKDSTIYVNPEEFNQSSKNIKNIAKAISMNEERLRILTKKRDLRYIPILKKLSMDKYEELKDFKEEESAAVRRWIIEKEDSISSFFIFEARPTRYYPENKIASQVIWFVDSEWVWHYWIEWYFNDILKWNNWQIIAKKDIKWRILDPINSNKKDFNNEWVEIITTIDRNIQEKVETILAKWVWRYLATKGSIVVMEPKTGRILAMANYPTYDLNNYSDVYEIVKINNNDFLNPEIDLLWYPILVEDSLEWEKFYYNDKEIFLREATLKELWQETLVKYRYKNWFWAWVYKNDAISSLYEPGSIMKAITVAIWIDTWEIKANSKYRDSWKVIIDQFKIVNVDQEKCMWYKTFQNALSFSCNVWMVRIMQRLWKPLSHQYLEDFGFWEKTWIDLEWEVFSELKPREKISRANLFTRSYGLWISVTPLQMANAYSILANWWIYMKPKIIEKIIYPDGREQIFKNEAKRRVLKEETSKIITNMLYKSAEVWFAKNGRVEGYSVAWKTWTAEISYRWVYKNWIGWTNASYAWFWPVEDPKFVIIVKLERPKSNVYWSQTSAHLFREVATYLFDYFEIPKKGK